MRVRESPRVKNACSCEYGRALRFFALTEHLLVLSGTGHLCQYISFFWAATGAGPINERLVIYASLERRRRLPAPLRARGSLCKLKRRQN